MKFRYCLTVVFCFAAPGAALFAGEPKDPLSLVPKEAEFVLKIENPAELARTVYNLKAVKEIQKIEVVSEQLDSTNVRRFFQLIGYFEKKLGADRYELIDKLAGNGMVLASKVQKDPPALLIVQGKDAETTKKFVELTIHVIEEELARQGNKQTVKRGKYKGFDGFRIGKQVYAGVSGATMILTNKDKALKAAIDLHGGQGRSVVSDPSLLKARKMLGGKPQAWLWFDLNEFKKQDGAKQLFGIPKAEPILNFNPIPPMIDLAGRAQFVCAGFYHQKNRFTYRLCIPKGLKGMPKHVAAFFPNDRGTTLPLLEPPNVLASGSFYVDLAKLWKNRDILKPEQLKQIEQFEKISGRFTGGVKLSQLLLKTGSQYRAVVTQPTESVYKKRKPNQPLPAFGVVHQMRDPSLGRTMDRMLRTVAIFGAGFLNLKMVEEKHGGVTLVTYRFPENREFKQDTENIRYAFSPSFATVGDQFMTASTVELGRDLVKILQKEKNLKPVPVTFQAKAYSKGGAIALETIKDQLVTQFVLSQAQPIEDARSQVKALIDLVRDLGTAEVETIYNQNDFQMNVVVDLRQ